MKHSVPSTLREVASTWREKRRWRAPEALRIWVRQKEANKRCSRMSIISSASLSSTHAMTLFSADHHAPTWQYKTIEQKFTTPHPQSKQRATLGLLHWHFFSNTATQRNATSTISSLHGPQKQTLQSISFQPDTSFVIDKYDTAALVITSQESEIFLLQKRTCTAHRALYHWWLQSPQVPALNLCH